MHIEFVLEAIERIKKNPAIIGLAAGGSWIGNAIDEYSDIDLVLVTDKLVSDSYNKMLDYANSMGDLLNAFTGEHVGEKRLLICLYDNPLIHVDIKFVTLDEFKNRVENPVVLWDREGALTRIIDETVSSWPRFNYQWIEDRFWTWIHYAALKIGRGEYFEALDFISFLRVSVISPLLQIKNGQLPRGLRKIEQHFTAKDLDHLKQTIPIYSPASIAESLEKIIELYRDLRGRLYGDDVILRIEVEQKCVNYFIKIRNKSSCDNDNFDKKALSFQ